MRAHGVESKTAIFDLSGRMREKMTQVDKVSAWQQGGLEGIYYVVEASRRTSWQGVVSLGLEEHAPMEDHIQTLVERYKAAEE